MSPAGALGTKPEVLPHPRRCGRENMLDAAIWIGVALFGLLLLGIFERVRTSSFIRANGETIKAHLPIAALAFLGLLAGSIAYLFFFLFFMADIWQYALIIGGLTFAFLFLRIRRNWSEFARSPRTGLLQQQSTAASGLFPRIGTLFLQAAGAMVALFMLLPVLTGVCLLYNFVTHIVGSVIANLLLVVAVLSLTGYLYSRLRAPSPSDAERPD